MVILVSGCTRNIQETNDWPQFPGPYRNSTSDQKGIFRYWPEKGPKILWTVDSGTGFGEAAVRLIIRDQSRLLCVKVVK